MTSIRRIALLNPLPDFGIQSYTYELAEGLAANGAEVDVYTTHHPRLLPAGLPCNHRVFPVLGNPVLLRRSKSKTANRDYEARHANPNETGSSQLTARAKALKSHNAYSDLRNGLLDFEIVAILKWKNYDLIWTQWHQINSPHFWQFARLLNCRVAHTVHNVLPHEERGNDIERCGKIYKNASHLLVHSEYSRQELLRLVPQVAPERVLISRHGTYTIFGRNPESRTETRKGWGIKGNEIALLFAGGVRPYKNIDSVLRALAIADSKIVLIVAGSESGFPDLVPGDPLGRTKRIAAELGITDRIRFIPGFAEHDELGKMLEASDILSLVYGKHYGSGLLSLGMTFGTHILATKAGGVDEYLDQYPCHTFTEDESPEAIARGLDAACAALRSIGNTACETPRTLDWKVIAKHALEHLG